MSRLTRPVLGMLLAAGLAAPVRAAEVEPLLPVETEGVIFVNVRQILDSDLIKKFALANIKQALQGQDAQKALKELGLDPLKDIDRVTAGTWGKDPKNMQGLAVLRGKFDPEKLFTAAQAATKKDDAQVEIVTEGTYKLVKFTPKNEKADNKPVYFAVADEKSIIGSNDPKLVADTLGKAAKGAKANVSKELAALVMSQDEKASMYMCGLTEGKVDLPPNLNLPNVDSAKLAKQLESMKSMSVTLRLTKDVGLEVAMGMKNEDAADDFAGTVDQMIGTAKTFLPFIAGNQPQAKPLVDEVTKTLKSNVKDKNVAITLSLSGDAIGKMAGGGAD